MVIKGNASVFSSSTPGSSSATSPLDSNMVNPPQGPQVSTQPSETSEPVATPPSSTRPTAAVSVNLPTGPLILIDPPEGMQRAFRSDIWEHFTPYWKGTKKFEKDLQSETVIETIVWKMRAKCKYCPKGSAGDYACDSTPNGTGGLRKHIFNRVCKYYPGNRDLKNQKVLAQGDFKKLVCVGFNQKDTMEACVEMVVVDELPFSFVEKKGFRKFCSTGMPLFRIPSRRSLVRLFLDMYQSRKVKLRTELKSYRICLTTDTWTSLQNYNYMVLTAHYIDCNWKMHKRVLNFCVITNHLGSTIADLIEQCLSDWGIDKVLAITVDNASSNQTALELLRDRFNDCENPQSILEGKNMHVRCVAHITNLIVETGLRKLKSSIQAIRNSVKFVRSSPARLELFKKAVAREKLPYKGLVCLDIRTRWNSTYLMLESAFRLKRAFKRMEQDPNGLFVAYFNEPDEEFDKEGNVRVPKKGQKKVGPPVEDDWENCEVFVNFLKIFYDITLRVSTSTRPTIHTTLHDIIEIEQAMDKLVALHYVEGDAPTNHLMGEVGAVMKSKYNKYFGEFKKLNPFILLGVVLDPRFKYRYVDHLLTKVMEWPYNEVERKRAEIKLMMIALYNEYVQQLESGNHVAKRIRVGSPSSGLTDVRSHKNTSKSMLVDDWSRQVEATNEAEISHEIERYLTDPLLSMKNGDEADEDYRMFDVLEWWKLSSEKYPILCSIARDVFAIQVSTVASESAFSTGGRVIDAFRCSLTPSSVEALICMQNWLRGDDPIVQLEDEPSTEELEFYESIETECANAKAESMSTNTIE